jgi:hypothetical protein
MTWIKCKPNPRSGNQESNSLVNQAPGHRARCGDDAKNCRAEPPSAQSAETAAHEDGEQQKINEGNDRGRKRQADVAEWPDKQRVHHVIDQDRNETDQHRSTGVIQSIKGRREHLDRRVAGETDRVSRQRIGGLSRIEAGKSTVFEDERDNRPT